MKLNRKSVEQKSERLSVLAPSLFLSPGSTGKRIISGDTIQQAPYVHPVEKTFQVAMSKTSVELKITCARTANGERRNLAARFDDEGSEKNHPGGFVCGGHRAGNRVERLTQPTTLTA
jgi:hypothetical protein